MAHLARLALLEQPDLQKLPNAAALCKLVFKGACIVPNEP